MGTSEDRDDGCLHTNGDNEKPSVARDCRRGCGRDGDDDTEMRPRAPDFRPFSEARSAGSTVSDTDAPLIQDVSSSELQDTRASSHRAAGPRGE